MNQRNEASLDHHGGIVCPTAQRTRFSASSTLKMLLLIAGGYSIITHAASSEINLARELALAEYDVGHFAVAAMHFREAAERGDLRSAETLSLMYRYGERLYGEAFPADAAEAKRWAAIAVTRYAACRQSEIAIGK